MSSYPLKRFTSIFNTIFDDQFSRILPEFVACANTNCLYWKDAPYGRLFVANRTVWSSTAFNLSTVCFWWRRLRLRAFQVQLLSGCLWRSSICRTCRLLFKLRLRLRGQVSKAIFAYRGECLLYVNRSKQALSLAMWLLKIHCTKKGRINISRTEFIVLGVAVVYINGGLDPICIKAAAFVVGATVVFTVLLLFLTTLTFSGDFPRAPRRCFEFGRHLHTFSE